MADTPERGRFVWYDLMTTDPEAAVGFYTRVVGWGTQLWEASTPPYTMWTRGDAPLGGVVELPSSADGGAGPPHWLAYLLTPDTDATAEHAAGLGAHLLVPPTDIPTVGRYAILADPHGAAFALFTPEGDSPGPEGPPEAGDVSWHELATTDPEAALEFYGELFGWEETGVVDMGEAGLYRMFGTGGRTLGGIFQRTEELASPPAWLCYVRVDDLEGATERVEELGGQVVAGPMEVPGGDRIAQCLDPQGAPFALHATAGA